MLWVQLYIMFMNSDVVTYPVAWAMMMHKTNSIQCKRSVWFFARKELTERFLWGINLFDIHLICDRNVVMNKGMWQQASESTLNWTIEGIMLFGSGDTFHEPALAAGTIVQISFIKGANFAIVRSDTTGDAHFPLEAEILIL